MGIEQTVFGPAWRVKNGIVICYRREDIRLVASVELADGYIEKSELDLMPTLRGCKNQQEKFDTVYCMVNECTEEMDNVDSFIKQLLDYILKVKVCYKRTKHGNAFVLADGKIITLNDVGCFIVMDGDKEVYTGALNVLDIISGTNKPVGKAYECLKDLKKEYSYIDIEDLLNDMDTIKAFVIDWGGVNFAEDLSTPRNPKVSKAEEEVNTSTDRFVNDGETVKILNKDIKVELLNDGSLAFIVGKDTLNIIPAEQVVQDDMYKSIARALSGGEYGKFTNIANSSKATFHKAKSIWEEKLAPKVSQAGHKLFDRPVEDETQTTDSATWDLEERRRRKEEAAKKLEEAKDNAEIKRMEQEAADREKAASLGMSYEEYMRDLARKEEKATQESEREPRKERRESSRYRNDRYDDGYERDSYGRMLNNRHGRGFFGDRGYGNDYYGRDPYGRGQFSGDDLITKIKQFGIMAICIIILVVLGSC